METKILNLFKYVEEKEGAPFSPGMISGELPNNMYKRWQKKSIPLFHEFLLGEDEKEINQLDQQIREYYESQEDSFAKIQAKHLQRKT